MKEKLSSKELETFKKFMRRTLFEISDPLYSLDYLKFVFKEEDIKLIEEYLDLDVFNYRIVVNYLKKNLELYNTRNENDNNMYIYVDDLKRFFFLLNKIKEKTNFNLLKTIWLRMNVSDLNDVNGFLKRELEFVNSNITLYDKDNYYGCSLTCEDEDNPDFFETNKHISFTLHKDSQMYKLPVVHYAVRNEDNKNVCYIYGIQNMTTDNNCDIKEILKQYRKTLKKCNVSPSLVMSLELFLDLLKSNNITNIKVPLIQIFNYPYHEALSENHRLNYDSYTEEDILKYENMDKDSDDPNLMYYLYTKKSCEKFMDQQDKISKNKTERLIDIFMILEEKSHDIEFLNDLFIEDENLNIKLR